MNYKRTRCTKQAFYSLSPNISPSIAADPHGYLANNFSITEYKALNYILSVGNCCKKIYFSQETVATKIGCVRETINRIFFKFEALGIIASNYRHMTSCEYKISEYFEDLNVRKSLCKIFKCLWYLPLAILLSRAQRVVAAPAAASHTNIIKKNISISNPIYKGNPNSIKTPVRCRFGGDNIMYMTGRGQENMSRRIKELNLTEAGRIKLGAFPQEVLDYATGVLQKHKGDLKEPFAFYSAICVRYCKEKSILPAWFVVFRELDRLGLSKTGPFVDADAPLIWEEVAAGTGSRGKGKEHKDSTKQVEWRQDTPEQEELSRIKYQGIRDRRRIHMQDMAKNNPENEFLQRMAPMYDQPIPSMSVDRDATAEQKYLALKAEQLAGRSNTFLDIVILAYERQIVKDASKTNDKEILPVDKRSLVQ